MLQDIFTLFPDNNFNLEKAEPLPYKAEAGERNATPAKVYLGREIMRDPYTVLGVSPNASDEDIKKAYHSLARKCHPDLHPGDQAAAARMNEINRAYDQICEYRRTGRWPWENPRRSARQTYGYQTAYAASGDGTGTRNTAGGGGYYAYGASAGPGRPKPRRRPLLIFVALFAAFLIGLSVYASRTPAASLPERPGYPQQTESSSTRTVAAENYRMEAENSALSE